MPISMILDFVIAVLLVLTIVYAVRLNQRLSQLRADKNELQQLADVFVDATRRAEAGIAQLKISSDGLSAEIAQAEGLKDDLDYLVERGERLANGLTANGLTANGLPQGARAPQNPPRGASRPHVEKPSLRAAQVRETDPETRLIEEAIRAATPRFTETGKTSSRPLYGETPPRRDESVDGDDAIGDSQAARELLKALGTVK